MKNQSRKHDKNKNKAKKNKNMPSFLFQHRRNVLLVLRNLGRSLSFFFFLFFAYIYMFFAVSFVSFLFFLFQFSFARIFIKVLHTPGHSRGSITLLYRTSSSAMEGSPRDDEGIAFTGDHLALSGHTGALTGFPRQVAHS